MAIKMAMEITKRTGGRKWARGAAKIVIRGILAEAREAGASAVDVVIGGGGRGVDIQLGK